MKTEEAPDSKSLPQTLPGGWQGGSHPRVVTSTAEQGSSELVSWDARRTVFSPTQVQPI